MRSINKIIVHCSATQPSKKINAETIRKYHVEVNKWQDIGYHYVINVDGTVENGRPVEKQGAHCQGHNADSVGICLVGGIDEKGKSVNNFTQAQFDSLVQLVGKLRQQFGHLPVFGHREFTNKDCPCFEVRDVIKD